jgi:hypothetical protein
LTLWIWNWHPHSLSSWEAVNCAAVQELPSILLIQRNVFVMFLVWISPNNLILRCRKVPWSTATVKFPFHDKSNNDLNDWRRLILSIMRSHFVRRMLSWRLRIIQETFWNTCMIFADFSFGFALFLTWHTLLLFFFLAHVFRFAQNAIARFLPIKHLLFPKICNMLTNNSTYLLVLTLSKSGKN